MAKIYTERQMAKRRWRLGEITVTLDFLAVVGCCAVAIVCVLLLNVLVGWLEGDLPETFASVITAVQTALTGAGG